MKHSSLFRFFITVILIISGSALHALGRADDSEPQSVAGLENWDHSMDLSELPAGEYNILIRGTDRAGNIGTGGPYNVFIDPSIQVPAVFISTPAEGSRVGNTVNILGTAGDDKKVERVEIAVDDGNFQPAEGTSFWRATLDSSAWDEGPHTITVRARDGDNNESPPASVSFFKDTVKPLISVDSHGSGSYISGRIELKGTLTDLNGIRQGFISGDGGETLNPLKLSKGKEEGQWNFSHRIDTGNFEDGAFVLLIEAVDGLDSRSRQSFLYYIDNQPPELELIFPSVDEAVNGNITLIGRAEDTVGIASLGFEADNGTGGEIELSPGNPIWVLPLDYSGTDRKEARIRMTLTDIVGNRVIENFKIPLDPAADLPLPGLSEDSGTIEYRGVPVLTGMIQDDDGPVGRIEYSFNGGEWDYFEVSGPWSLSLENAVEGKNSVEMRAVDRYGTAGPNVKTEISTAPATPVVIIDSCSLNEKTEWFPGAVLDAMTPGIISGKVLNAGAAKLGWSINGGELMNLPLKNGEAPGEKVFDIRLPKNLESGRIELRVSGQDAAGVEFSTETVYYNYLRPQPAEDGTVPSYLIPDSNKLHLIYPESDIPTHTMLTPDVFISGWAVYRGRAGAIKSARLSGGNDFLDVTTAGNGFKITASGEGYAEETVLTVELENGGSLDSAPMNIASDATAPGITIKEPSAGSIIGNEFQLSVSAFDKSGVNELRYSVNGGKTFKTFSGEDAETIPTRGIPDGLLTLLIEAEDPFGNIGTKRLPLHKDTAPPEVSLITSEFGKGSEQVTFSGTVSDAYGVKNLTVGFLPPENEAEAEPGTEAEAGAEAEVKTEAEPVVYKAELNGNVFFLDVNLTAIGFEPDDVIVSAVDNAGNTAEEQLRLDIDLDAGRPLVDIHVPGKMSSTETGFDLSGIILDREGVASISYSLNDGPYIGTGSGNLFTIPLALSELRDDLNTVKMKAVDLNGLESGEAMRSFLVSMEPPSVQMDHPELDSVVKGKVILSGLSSDVNGIRAVTVSHDNGNTFQKAEGAEQWEYQLDTNLLKNGVSSLLIRAEDKAGVVTLITTLINVDNSPPEISLSHPADGEAVRGMLELSGRAVDNSGIRSMKIFLSPLGGEEVDDSPDDASGMTKEIESRGTILEKLALGDFEPGFYSFRAEAVDAADNISTVSRVIKLLPDEIRPPELLSPLPGETTGPRFSVQGFLPDRAARVLLVVDDEIFKVVDVDDDGTFRYDVTPEDGYPAGLSRLSLRIGEGGNTAESRSIELNYAPEGLWVAFDNLSQNQFVSDRFVIEGSSGYEKADIEPELLKKLNPNNLAFSFDGGKTFERLGLNNGRWKYTLYGEEVPDGGLDLLVRASNGEHSAYSRCRIVMDTKAPNLSLHSPEENARLYGSLSLSGAAYDENGMLDVSLSLREGDKDNYQTPSFIQGMYFDASALGATYFTAGMGLTFMDGNVKLQFQYGYAPTTYTDPETNLQRTARFGGNVFGGKLLANLAQVPFSWLFGPEFSALSATAALGANFSYFSGISTDDPDAWGVILAGIVGQIELPKIVFEERSFLTYASLFWEGQLWLISSDISPEIILLPSIGLRLGLL